MNSTNEYFNSFLRGFESFSQQVIATAVNSVVHIYYFFYCFNYALFVYTSFKTESTSFIHLRRYHSCH